MACILNVLFFRSPIKCIFLSNVCTIPGIFFFSYVILTYIGINFCAFLNCTVYHAVEPSHIS